MELVLKTLQILESVRQRFDELDELVCASEIIADNRYWRRLVDERAKIEDMANLYTQLKSLLDEYRICEDSDVLRQMQQLALKANSMILGAREGGDANIKITGKNADFCADLVKMYQLFAQNNAFDHELKPDGLVIFGAYERLKYENGTHKSDNSSAVVLVLKTAYEQAFRLNESDIRTDVFHSSGAGGQNVNKVQSAIRLTHIPSGIVVVCQDNRSQLANRESALKSLNSRVTAHYKKQNQLEFDDYKRKRVVESKQKIRLYNYAQNSVCDIRSGISLPLKSVLSGGEAFVAMIDSAHLAKE